MGSDQGSEFIPPASCVNHPGTVSSTGIVSEVDQKSQGGYNLEMADFQNEVNTLISENIACKDHNFSSLEDTTNIGHGRHSRLDAEISEEKGERIASRVSEDELSDKLSQVSVSEKCSNVADSTEKEDIR